MKLKTSVLLICILFVSATFISCKNKLTCKKIGIDFFSITEKLKTYEDTLVFLKQLDFLISENPFCEKAYQIRGQINIENKNFSLAKRDFLQALQINDSSVYSLYCLSTLYNLENINDSALMLVNKAVASKFKGKYVVEHNNYFSKEFDVPFNALINFRGILFYQLGVFDLAKNDFMNLVFQNYELGQTFAYLSVIYQRKNIMDSACYYHYKSFQHGSADAVDSLPTLPCDANQ